MIALIIDGEFQDQVKPSDPIFETPLFKCVHNAITKGDLTVTDSDKSIVRKAYLSYQKKAMFSEVTSSVQINKSAVESCYSSTKSFHGCNAGSNGIPKNIGQITGGETVNGTNLYPAKGSHVIAAVKVKDGVITAEVINGKGFNGETYVLTPTTTISGEVNWIVSGTCEAAGICK
jgi:type IV pilus assembly protein PilA